MDIRKSKTITKKDDIEFLIHLTADDITTSMIMELFGDYGIGPRFNTYDIITIPPDSYGPVGRRNKNAFTTTVGCFIFNKYFIEEDLFDHFKYINKTIDNKVFNDINTKLSYALLEDRIDIPTLKKYLMKTQKTMPYISIIAPNYTDKMLTCTDVINKKKKELYEKYKEGIDAGNEVIAEKMEKELLKFATDYMDGDPSMDMFISGARGNIGNNFKNMFVMKGVTKDPDPNAEKRYNVALSNYIDGIDPKEYVLFANSLAEGPYARSKKTQTGGYLEKLFLAAYQHLVLDEAGSDCGTKKYITVYLDKSNISMWMYCYIIDRGRLVELTSQNVDKYINTTVKMRYSSLCESKTGICNKCMGNLFYRQGIINVGVSTTTIPSTLKNISMKSFHDSNQKLHQMDLNTIFGI